MIEAENDSHVGLESGDLEGESIFLFCGSCQRNKPRTFQATFCVMCLGMGIMVIPVFMEVRHSLGTLTALLCGM